MNRREWAKSTLLAATVARYTRAQEIDLQWGNGLVHISVLGSPETLWSLSTAGSTYQIAPPSFFIDGKTVGGALLFPKRDAAPQSLSNGVIEHRFSGQFASDPHTSLELIFRIASDSPVVRFRYVLHGQGKLTGDGAQVTYFGVSLARLPQCKQVQLSVFNEMLHSDTAVELDVASSMFEDQQAAIGPILVGFHVSGRALLMAYEHGAQAPDSFLTFRLSSTRKVQLQAIKANYVPGQNADGYSTVWMQAGAVEGGLDQLAAEYRRFVLRYMSLNGTSRQPYIFYNTWNFQERNKWFHGKHYLDSMNPERILAEIDVAHRMGIEVFVMDTGWYEKTGDWQVSASRFPDGLAAVGMRLRQYGMRLGLWFDPTAAAVSSTTFARYRSCIRTVNSVEGTPRPIWETEESYPMCLVSEYSNGFAEALIRVAKETGARYFKWDAIGQYGCDSPHHWHGNESNTREERWNSYAFQLPLQMTRIVEQVAAAIPDALVDFDVTEGGRAMGLSFLSAGKYFLINNGPYKFNYDLPMDRDRENWNLFFYPGAARTWICRSPLTYDRWIPSVLFLTHYFPDDPRTSQLVNLASLILGQNGIWGDLPAVSDAGVQWIENVLRRYKNVREDVTASAAVVTGAVSGSPEIHEKISQQTGRGVVSLFATAAGEYTYVTVAQPVKAFWATAGTKVRFDDRGRAAITVQFNSSSAAIVFFGTSPSS